MATISELKKVEELFLSKLPEGSEISLDAEHDIIFFSCYKHSDIVDSKEFLTKEEVESVGLHYNEFASWAMFT